MPIAPHIKRLRDAIGHELLTLPSVSAIVFDEANLILMVQSADDGSWTTPGGAVDPNEHPADAVIRELWEETGLVARPVRLLGVFGGPESVVAYPNGDRTNYVNTVFECVVVSGNLRQRSSETMGARYVSETELATLNAAPWARPVVPRLYRRDTTPLYDPPTWRPPAG